MLQKYYVRNVHNFPFEVNTQLTGRNSSLFSDGQEVQRARFFQKVKPICYAYDMLLVMVHLNTALPVYTMPTTSPKFFTHKLPFKSGMKYLHALCLFSLIWQQFVCVSCCYFNWVWFQMSHFILWQMFSISKSMQILHTGVNTWLSS